MDSHGVAGTSLQEIADELRHRLWDDIRCHADNSDGSNCHKWQRLSVVAGKDGEIRGNNVPEGRHSFRRTSAFFDRYDCFAVRCQTGASLYADLARCTARHIIKHQFERG